MSEPNNSRQYTLTRTHTCSLPLLSMSAFKLLLLDPALAVPAALLLQV